MIVRFTTPATGKRDLEVESQTWVNDYTPEIFYAHRLVIEKADPRLT